MNAVRLVRWSALAEAVSYLILLFIAMPLKYGFDQPETVSVVGAIHGFLTVILAFGLLALWASGRWPLKRSAQVLVASMIPFAPFFVDPHLRRYDPQHPEFDPDAVAATAPGVPAATA